MIGLTGVVRGDVSNRLAIHWLRLLRVHGIYDDNDSSHQLPNCLDILNHFAILAIDAAIKRFRDKDNLADYHVVFNPVLMAKVCNSFLGHWLRSIDGAALSANLIAASNRSIARLAAAVKRGERRPDNIL